jgi:hypothetical protein
MAATVLVKFQGDLGELEAAISKLDQSTDQLSESAAAAGKKVSEEYRKVASSAKAAFASSEVDSAIKAQAANVDKLADNLDLLYKEELRLLKLNKEATAEFRNNQAAIAATRKEFDGLRKGVSDVNKELPKTAKEISELEDELKKLALEGKQGTQQFKDTAKAIGEYKAAILTADRAVDLYAKSTDAATGRLGELEDKLYDLALAGDRNTQEFKDTIAEVTKLKRAVFEVDQQVDSYVERSRGITSVVQSVELLGNAFQIVEGASAAFGVENEDLQETLVRLNAIMAITNGLEQVRTILLDQTAKKTGIAAVVQRAYTFAVGASTGAFKALRIAIAATGFGALVIALGFVITNFEEIKKVAFNAFPALQKVAEGIGFLIDKTKEFLGITDEIESNSLDKALKRQDTLLKAQVNALNRQIALQQKLGKETEQLEIQREQLQLNLAQKRLEFLNKNTQLRLANEELFATKVFELEQEVLDRQNNIAILRINNEKGLTQQISQELRERAAIRLKIEGETLTEQQKKEIEFFELFGKRLTELDETSNQERFNRRANFLKAEIAEGDNAFQTRIQLIKTEGEAQKAEVRERLGFTTDANNQIRIIEAETAERIKEARRQQIDEITQQTFQYIGAVQSVFSSIVDLQNELTERRIEQINRLRDVELEAIEVSSKSEAQKQREREALELRTNRKIIEEKRKIARLNKAQGIFDAVVNTAVAVTNALKQDPPLNIILAAAAGVTGGIQVAKISSEPLPSFGRGGWIDGEPHTRGGVDINAEGGEFVTRKSQAGTFRRELEAMNTSRASFLKLIENNYVKPRLMAATLERDRNGVSVNVNARLNSGVMESELRGLRQETRKTGKIMQKLVASSNSSRYNW